MGWDEKGNDMSKRSDSDMEVFSETERDPITSDEFEAALHRVIAHPSRSKIHSENREPNREELSRCWKMIRS